MYLREETSDRIFEERGFFLYKGNTLQKQYHKKASSWLDLYWKEITNNDGLQMNVAC